MHSAKRLNNRQEDVLRIVVNSHVQSALPVGSAKVAEMLGLSSATIRNVMVELEEMGYIAHPHTSAGRMPTDEGYRYYIDSLMQIRELSGNIIDSIVEKYRRDIYSTEDVMERTSGLISDLTRYVGITVELCSERVYFDGASHILEQPEFRDFKKLQNIFRCLEDKISMLHFLCDDVEDGRLAISIGKENKLSNFKDCTVVSRGYKRRGKASGRLGVIGPKRMVYEKVVPMVGFLADMVSRVIDEIDD
ncbi:MAG: hypothetical protein KKD29_00015 [Candidatus Omnitrophica bacterium]|nr:hypothetical protein [Candidatus Omnitrophota bacterium]MBU4487451.1 hypothetical protein [Candidatus Omnitrophota bacterium]MCG2705097.1 hypothetical protein [Candidatus Omnitrophota bacterium]